MATLKLVRGNIFSQAVADGQLLFDTTKNQLYIDVDTNRIHIGGTVDVESFSALGTLTSAQVQANSLYYVADENALYKHVNGSFIKLTSAESSGDVTVEVEVVGEGDVVKNVQFVDNKIVVTKGNVPTYKIVKSAAASGESQVSSYQLVQVAPDGSETIVGDKIDIPADIVIKSGSVKTVTEANQPYDGAVVGDNYIDLVLNDATESHIYIPTKDLANDYAAGMGINIADRTISVKVVAGNGLTVGENGIALALATNTTAGAMSAEDKVAITGAKNAFTWTTV